MVMVACMQEKRSIRHTFETIAPSSANLTHSIPFGTCSLLFQPHTLGLPSSSVSRPPRQAPTRERTPAPRTAPPELEVALAPRRIGGHGALRVPQCLQEVFVLGEVFVVGFARPETRRLSFEAPSSVVRNFCGLHVA
jgi:hypothetical protein